MIRQLLFFKKFVLRSCSITMFLERYKNKKRLGKGAYGDVYLVEDEKGHLFALKLISYRMIQKEPHLQQYLDGQIQCMKMMNSPNIIKLYNIHQDADFYYLCLQYCDGGDLVNYQARFKDKVFPLNKSIQILAEVIRGLQALHNEQYLHRDIKSQNVLVKMENGREVFKLADFGFSKKQADVEGTILGTEQYMSPQIYRGNEYGYEVDMWAFGVLFFFMLNLQFPFKMNPHWPASRKQAQLRSAAENFSYTAVVKKTKKRIMSNCVPDIQNLFQQIFEVNPLKRINFAEIRKHPIFAKYFPDIAQASIILYNKKFKRKQNQNSFIQKKNQQQNVQNVIPTSKIYRKKNIKFQLQKEALDKKKDQIDFLRDNVEIFMKSGGDMLKTHEKYMLAYNIQKYYIILMRRHRVGLGSKNYLNEKYPGLQWNDYIVTPDFKKQIKDVEEDLGRAEVKFQTYYDNCNYLLNEICDVNSSFKKNFKVQINQTEFDGDFKESYRKSTSYIFGILRQLHKKGEKKGNKLNYLLVVLLISNSFNNLFDNKIHLQSIFDDYLTSTGKKVDKIDYSQLRSWLETSSAETLHEIAKTIVRIYFGV